MRMPTGGPSRKEFSLEVEFDQGACKLCGCLVQGTYEQVHAEWHIVLLELAARLSGIWKPDGIWRDNA